MIRAVLFDMDGVVADTQEAVTAFWRDLAAGQGFEITPEDFRRHVYGLPALHTLDTLFPALGGVGRAEALALMYRKEVAGPYREIAGAVQLLGELRDAGIPTALVTSAEPPKVDAVVTALGLAGMFTVTVTRNDITRGKPDPEGYLLAAIRLDIDPGGCLVLEDALSGVEAAVAAGCACVGVTVPEFADVLLTAGAAAIVPDLRGIRLEISGEAWVLNAAGTRFELSGPDEGLDASSIRR